MEPARTTESRDRLVHEAKRKDLVDGARRARLSILGGILVGFAGGAVWYFMVMGGMLGLAGGVMVGGLLLITIPMGFAMVVRGIMTIAIARKHVRELDELLLPAARVVQR